MPVLPILMLLLAMSFPAGAQDLPRCTPEVAGAVVCMAGRSCACEFQRGGLMIGQPEGWRWDCGILRGNCGPPPVQLGPDFFELPPGLSIDSSDNSIHLDQTTGVNGSGQQNIDRQRGDRWIGQGQPPPGLPIPLFPEHP
ncbi:MAG TPA: hypothetical protein VHL31_08520 [Geminicoccus sp.]|uniref:hypothetical protein n=1 Tax=Geminicoccus sp. TaxID=2024832 RepID=UPI002E358886|nr:hypothetical protein [Geminicoccus sp.]HEX2526334.1 hypothetical protein [Geminicoccus sp.]